MKIGCKIESVVRVNFKNLLAKIANLIFKYILSSYFIECSLRCSKKNIFGFHFLFFILKNTENTNNTKFKEQEEF